MCVWVKLDGLWENESCTLLWFLGVLGLIRQVTKLIPGWQVLGVGSLHNAFHPRNAFVKMGYVSRGGVSDLGLWFIAWLRVIVPDTALDSFPALRPTVACVSDDLFNRSTCRLCTLVDFWSLVWSFLSLSVSLKFKGWCFPISILGGPTCILLIVPRCTRLHGFMPLPISAPTGLTCILFIASCSLYLLVYAGTKYIYIYIYITDWWG